MKRDSVSVHVVGCPTSPFPQLRMYLMDSLFLNQKTIKNIWTLYSLKYKHSKKHICEKISGTAEWNKPSKEKH